MINHQLINLLIAMITMTTGIEERTETIMIIKGGTVKEEKERSLGAMVTVVESLTGEVGTRTGIVEETMTEATDLVIEITTENVTHTGTVIEDRIGTRTNIVTENEILAFMRKIVVIQTDTILSETNMLETEKETIHHTEMIAKMAVEEAGEADVNLLFVVGGRMRAGREYIDVAKQY